jgi:tetratricopeptide (TPR) repeat protein
MGEYYWNAEAYEEAEARFLDLAVKYPDSPLADEGYFWAGRSAARRSDFVRAVEHFGVLAKQHPASPLLPEARILQGDALTLLGRDEDINLAILAFEEVIRQWPDSYHVDAAWGRKGDCLWTMGTKLPEGPAQDARLEEALAAYRIVAESPTASFELQLQAGFKIGRCLEKMGRTDEAFARYMDVMYAYVGGVRQGEADALWFTRAAFKAAGIMKSRERWEEAVSIYRRVVRERVPASEEAEKLLQEIRLKHWLPF